MGIKTSRIISPAIALSIFMTGLTFYFNDNLVPASNKLAEMTLRAGIGSSFSAEQGKDNIMFSRYGSRISASIKNLQKQIHILLIYFMLHGMKTTLWRELQF